MNPDTLFYRTRLVSRKVRAPPPPNVTSPGVCHGRGCGQVSSGPRSDLAHRAGGGGASAQLVDAPLGPGGRGGATAGPSREKLEGRPPPRCLPRRARSLPSCLLSATAVCAPLGASRSLPECLHRVTAVADPSPYSPRGRLDEAHQDAQGARGQPARAARAGGADGPRSLLAPRPSQHRRAPPGPGGRAATPAPECARTQASTQVCGDAEPQAPRSRRRCVRAPSRCPSCRLCPLPGLLGAGATSPHLPGTAPAPTPGFKAPLQNAGPSGQLWGKKLHHDLSHTTC